jgi:ComF family protein
LSLNKINKRNEAVLSEKSEKLGGLPYGKPSNFYDFAAKTANCSVNPYLAAGLIGKRSGKCQTCQDKKLSGLYFALPYKEKSLTRKLIRQFKYEPYIKDLSKVLSIILIEHLVLTKNNTNDIWDNSVLMPVPLEKKKLKNRGYNQSQELAQELAKTLKLPVIVNALIKIKPTQPQMKLSAKEREENLKGVFLVNNKEDITGKKIFLVDDVYTTGSTMEECARVLRDNGARSVWGIAIAREG